MKLLIMIPKLKHRYSIEPEVGEGLESLEKNLVLT